MAAHAGLFSASSAVLRVAFSFIESLPRESSEPHNEAVVQNTLIDLVLGPVCSSLNRDYAVLIAFRQSAFKMT